MKSLPAQIVDLVFADPPYNLEKNYGDGYNDASVPQDYLKWTEEWLVEIIRLLKPTGSFYLLNLPKWALHHAVFLDKYMYRQNTISWDALSTPRGKIMPAHYTLLFYTKSASDYTFNRLKVVHNWTHCARETCIIQRNSSTLPKSPYSDIWSNIYRVKHRNKRYKHHPTQLPLPLMERIILTSSKEGDIVFDPFCGVGTTPLVAKMLGRRYLGIEINAEFAQECIRNLKNSSSYRSRLELSYQ